MEVMNRFKGLFLQTVCLKNYEQEVHSTVQEAVIKIIPKKKKCKRERWLSQEVLKIAGETREAKGMEERERYNQLNAEIQRITAGREKKVLNKECKEIDDTNRMENTSDVFQKTGDIKGIFLQG